MKPKFLNNYKKNINNKSLSLSFLFNLNKKTDNDPISKFLKNYDTSKNINNETNNLNTNNNFNEKNEIKSSNVISPKEDKNKEEELSKNDNIIISNSFFNNQNNSKNISKGYYNESVEKNLSKFPLAIVELKNIDNSKKENIFLTESVKKKKKKINMRLSDENNNSFFRNNKIIYNFYTDYMRRKKQKELIESKLFKQKLYSQFLKYSPNYMKKYVTKIEYNLFKEKEELELLKSENNLKKYKEFKNRITRRLIEGNIDYENENTNLFINSIHNFLYKNIMNYENLIYLLSRLKGKISVNFAKMISEFLSQKFDCFHRVKKSTGGQLKLIKLVELLKLEKYKKGDIVYDIDSYENKYMLLLKGKIDVYERKFSKENMKIKDFINYLKDIKEKENNLIKLYRIIQKNIIENTFDKFDILEQYSFDYLSIKEYINISNKKEFFIEEVNRVGNRIQGDNINMIYKNEIYFNTDKISFNKNYRKESISRNASPENIKDYFKNKENRIYFLQNYSDKRYICTEDCFLVSIEKEGFNKRFNDLENRLYGESGEMLLLYTFIFKNWKKEIINSIIKKLFIKKYLMNGEHLYNQNDRSDSIYIIIRGEFTQTISLNTKRMEEVKKYILFNKTNIFNIWKNKQKKSINKEEIENFFESQEKINGDFPYEITDKNNEIKEREKENKNKKKENINKFYFQYFNIKKKEENDINNVNNLKIKKCFKFEVLGIEDAIEGKHRFTSVKCESRQGEILEIKLSDFIKFCFNRNINIDYLKEIIIDLKHILIKTIERVILVERNSLLKTINTYDTKEKDNIINNSQKKCELKINKKIYQKNYFEERLFDPFEIALKNMKKYKKSRIKEKFNIMKGMSNYNNKTCRSYKKNLKFKDLFFDFFTEKNKNEAIKIDTDNLNKENYTNTNNLNTNKNDNNKNECNNIENNINNNLKNDNNYIKINSARNLKKKFFIENLRINNINCITNRNKNNEKSEREKIKRKYLIAKKKLEESYFNREKVYYMKNFKNFPFVKYIYGKNKKRNINTEESLYTKINKDMAKQQKLNTFLKKLNSSNMNNNVLFSKSVIKEAGYYRKNNSYKKIYIRNNKGNNSGYSHCNTENMNDNYNLDVWFLKHIDF